MRAFTIIVQLTTLLCTTAALASESDLNNLPESTTPPFLLEFFEQIDAAELTTAQQQAFRNFFNSYREIESEGWLLYKQRERGELSSVKKTAYRRKKTTLLKVLLPQLIQGLPPSQVFIFADIFAEKTPSLYRMSSQEADISLSIADIDHAFQQEIRKRRTLLEKPDTDADLALRISGFRARLADILYTRDLVAKTWQENYQWGERHDRNEYAQETLDSAIPRHNATLTELTSAIQAELQQPIGDPTQAEELRNLLSTLEQIPDLPDLLLPSLSERQQQLLESLTLFTPLLPAVLAKWTVEDLIQGNYFSGALNALPPLARGKRLFSRMPPATWVPKYENYAIRFPEAVELVWNESGLREALWAEVEQALLSVGIPKRYHGLAKFVVATMPIAILGSRSAKLLGSNSSAAQWIGASVHPASQLAMSGITYVGERKLGRADLPLSWLEYFDEAGDQALHSAGYTGTLYYLGRFGWGRDLARFAEWTGFLEEMDHVVAALIEKDSLVAVARLAASAIDLGDPLGAFYLIAARGAIEEGVGTEESLSALSEDERGALGLVARLLLFEKLQEQSEGLTNQSYLEWKSQWFATTPSQIVRHLRALGKDAFAEWELEAIFKDLQANNTSFKERFKTVEDFVINLFPPRGLPQIDSFASFQSLLRNRFNARHVPVEYVGATGRWQGYDSEGNMLELIQTPEGIEEYYFVPKAGGRILLFTRRVE